MSNLRKILSVLLLIILAFAILYFAFDFIKSIIKLICIFLQIGIPVWGIVLIFATAAALFGLIFMFYKRFKKRKEN